jgi:hypothetical protein
MPGWGREQAEPRASAGSREGAGSRQGGRESAGYREGAGVGNKVGIPRALKRGAGADAPLMDSREVIKSGWCGRVSAGSREGARRRLHSRASAGFREGLGGGGTVRRPGSREAVGILRAPGRGPEADGASMVSREVVGSGWCSQASAYLWAPERWSGVGGTSGSQEGTGSGLCGWAGLCGLPGAGGEGAAWSGICGLPGAGREQVAWLDVPGLPGGGRAGIGCRWASRRRPGAVGPPQAPRRGPGAGGAFVIRELLVGGWCGRVSGGSREAAANSSFLNQDLQKLLVLLTYLTLRPSQT